MGWVRPVARMGRKRYRYGFVRKREDGRSLGRPGYRKKCNSKEMKFTDVEFNSTTGLLQPLLENSRASLSVTMKPRVSINQKYYTWDVQVTKSPKEASAAAMQSWRELCEIVYVYRVITLRNDCIFSFL